MVPPKKEEKNCDEHCYISDLNCEDLNEHGLKLLTPEANLRAQQI